MNQIPNIISIARIFFSFGLLVFYHNLIIFIITYLLCGISDILDGYLARKYKVESRIGEQLDSLGDFIFFSITFYLIITSTNILSYKWLLIGIGIVFIVRIVNFILTKVKFKTWGMLHTWANKFVGLLLYFYIAIAITNENILFVLGIILCLIAFYSAIEETIILVLSREYDANFKSLISLFKS